MTEAWQLTRTPNLTTEEMQSAIAAYDKALEADKGNDGLMSNAIVAVAAALSSLVKRNGEK